MRTFCTRRIFLLKTLEYEQILCAEVEQLMEDYLRGREAVLDRREKPGIKLIPDSKEKNCCVCSDRKQPGRKKRSRAACIKCHKGLHGPCFAKLKCKVNYPRRQVSLMEESVLSPTTRQMQFNVLPLTELMSYVRPNHLSWWTICYLLLTTTGRVMFPQIFMQQLPDYVCAPLAKSTSGNRALAQEADKLFIAAKINKASREIHFALVMR
ncbi:hypothetical protein PoB_003192400 [Plakobranchus ocellatus]|uniref:PiggyBac transposable element-derived protein domain-containing protein n=1 Tax=Plakobranchus ocellatus TaxID=259542 RepID=A0AAV4ACR1_9GAST|nr:hypothetical protein PoB_003192400 [Plakobranchus ocellatus]